jgi:hypothetical protein
MNSDSMNPPAKPREARKPVDAETLLASLAPVVSRPEPASTPVKREVEPPAELKLPKKKPVPKAAKPEPQSGRATLDVAINPGEGTTAIYVRVPRTTHMALKLLALQNQAVMEGPTELASIVRTAIDEYLTRQKSSRAA